MDLHTLSALELRASLERGEVSSVEVVTALHACDTATDDAIAVALAICTCATLVPSWWAARLLPADGVRYE